MLCPRCEKPTLFEKDRDGVTVDVCGECRGLWLDRGELEKIMARETRHLEEIREGKHHSGPRHQKRQKSWFEHIADLVGG